MTDTADYFQDVLLLLLGCCSFLFFTDIRFSLVLAFCCTLILLCACYFLETPGLRLGLLLLFLIAACVLPDFFCFYPVAAYLLFREKQRVLPFVGLLVCTGFFLCAKQAVPVKIFLGFLLFALAWMLQKHTEKYESLLREFRSTRDDSKERNLLLAEKNQALAEKQNSQIYTATLRERNRIAREIHDNVGHVLSRSLLMVGAIRTVNTQETLTPMLEQLHTSLDSAMDSIRTSVHDLHDESINLKEVMNSMLQEFTFCPVQLHFDMSHEVPTDVKYCLISIVKEALSNIIRHSHATRVQILLREHPALYQLCIEDNGEGSPSSVIARETKASDGMGLSNMKERALSLGGTFQVIRENGFKIFITIPKKGAF